MGDSYIGILNWDACQCCVYRLPDGACGSDPWLIPYVGEFVECGNFEEVEG